MIIKNDKKYKEYNIQNIYKNRRKITDNGKRRQYFT